MKKQSMITLALLAVLLLVGTGYAAGAAGAQPGSNADPLVSKSYVDEQVASIFRKNQDMRRLPYRKESSLFVPKVHRSW